MTPTTPQPRSAESNGDRPARVSDSRLAEIVKAAYLLELTRR
jgi:hypothetical protein